MDVIIKTNEFTLKRRAFLILIASGSRVGGFNISKFTKNPKFNDGKLDVRIFIRNHIFSWVKIIWFYLFKGRHFHNDRHLNANYVKISIPNKYTWNVDGEAGPIGEIEVYVNPKKIKKLF